MGPNIYRRFAPGFYQKQSKRPEIFRRYAPEPCKSTRRETHHQRFPHRAILRLRHAPTGELKHMGAMSCHKTLLFPLGVGGAMVWRSLG